MTPLPADEPFQFSCSNKVPCFNDCCRDLNQFLTPYDILRLKKNLRLTSVQFLKQYTSQHIGPETGLPIITLRPDYTTNLKCPFVTPQGCSVYEDRPASCRMYPLARAIFRSRLTGQIEEQFMLLKEPHCRGFEHGPKMTAHEWMRQQDLTVCNAMNDRMMAIISIKRQLKPGPLDMKTNRMFSMACYDLDAFRQYIAANGLPDNLDTQGVDLATLPTDDVALLKIAFKWILHELFDVTESEIK